MLGFLAVRVGSDLKDRSSVHEGPLSVYQYTGTDGVHGSETWQSFLQVNAQQKKKSLLPDAMIKILRPLKGAWSAILR